MPAKRYAVWVTGLTLFVCWQSGSLAGALLGSVIDPRDFGLDAAAPAVYLALLWPAFKEAENRWVGLAGVIALALVPFVPPGVLVLAAASAALVAGLSFRSGGPMTALWVAVIVAAIGTYLLKLAGVSRPSRHSTIPPCSASRASSPRDALRLGRRRAAGRRRPVHRRLGGAARLRRGHGPCSPAWASSGLRRRHRGDSSAQAGH